MYAVVQVEAFCRGKPVVSTNIPRSGVPEVNRDGDTGFTVEINNPKAIADKISLLLNNSELYGTFCKNALARGRHLTDMDNTIGKYIELFKNL
jgi:glycosyltransferase involved in cell wall biosynthesis